MTNLNVSWSAAPGANCYVLYVGTTLGSNNVYTSTQLTTTSVTIPLLAPATTYYLRIFTNISGAWYTSDSSFQTANGIARVTSPSNGAFQLDPSNPISITWTTTPDATSYFLYIGTTLGGNDVYTSGTTLKSSVSVQFGSSTTYYLRIFTQKGSAWYYTDSTLQTGRANAVVTSPTNGATNISPVNPTQITWTTVPDAIAYYLYVGTTLGGTDVYTNGGTTGNSATVQLGPTTKYYLRLFSQKADGWHYEDTSFTTTTSIARIVSPAKNATAVDPTYPITINWTSVPDAVSYYLYIGTTAGGSDVYASGEVQATSASRQLLANTTYYLRIWTRKANNAWSYTDSVFTTGRLNAKVTSPANGATAVDPSSPTTITWTPVSDASKYFLSIGTTKGGNNVFNSGDTLGTSASLQLGTNSTYYLRLFTVVGSSWYYEDSSFQTGTGIAHLISPANGSTIDPTFPVTFTWNSISDALSYSIYVGSSVGAGDIFNSGAITAASATAQLTQNSTYYIRISTTKSSGTLYQDYTIKSGALRAVVTTPTNGNTNLDPTDPVPVNWTAVSDANSYFLYVGTSVGANNVYASGQIQSTAANVHLSPQTTYYARIWTQKGSAWFYEDSSFASNGGRAKLTNPANNSTGVSPFVTISWTPIATADTYFLTIGTSPGAQDIYSSGDIPNSVSSIQPNGLIPNSTYYVRLYTITAGAWMFNDYSFSTGSTSVNSATLLSNVETFTDQVRSQAAIDNTPVAGTQLASVVQARGKSAADCGDFATVLASVLTSNNISARIRAVTLDGTSTEAHVIVEYFDPNTSKWAIADSTFGLVYNDGAGHSWGVEDVSAAVNAFNFNIPKIWLDSNQDYWYRTYYMDPLTLYVNVYPSDGSGISTYNDFTKFVTPRNLADVAGIPRNFIFQYAQPTDTLGINDGVATPITVVPIQAAPWIVSAATTLAYGWSATSVPSGLSIYTLPRYWTNTSDIIAPVPAPTKLYNSYPYVLVRWHEIYGASGYRLLVGSSAGASDMLDTGVVQTQNTTLTNLGPNTTYYLTLYTYKNSNTYTYTSTFQTSSLAISQLISPPDTSTVSVGSVGFQWNSVSNATAYVLYVGTSFGTYDVYRSTNLTTTSQSVNIPNAGTYFVRIWTKIGTSWYWQDSTFTAQ